MASIESQRILQWLYQNIKNANFPNTIQEARANIEMLASRNHASDEITVESISADGVNCELLASFCSKSDKYILFLNGGAMLAQMMFLLMIQYVLQSG